MHCFCVIKPWDGIFEGNLFFYATLNLILRTGSCDSTKQCIGNYSVPAILILLND